VFDGPDLPAPLSDLSPWLDQKTRTVDEVHRMLAGQEHRRFIKTHSPLDGVPDHPDVTYLAVGRDPRDAAISLIHHQLNTDRERLDELLVAAGAPPRKGRNLPGPDVLERLGDVLRAWMDDPGGGGTEPLAVILEQFDVAWQRRHRPNVALFHFADYVADLPTELQRLAGILGYDVPRSRIEQLAEAASIDAMRERAPDLAPNASQGLWKDDARFFRSGLVGEWRTYFDADDLVHYGRRVAELVSPELARWAHHGREGGDPAQA
jgi:hypothetical protein